MMPPPPISAVFPYTTLFRSGSTGSGLVTFSARVGGPVDAVAGAPLEDRKSTRLNSSHEWSSYAVCCLKKKQDQAGRLLHRHRVRDGLAGVQPCRPRHLHRTD